jgi:hypothetical protein
MRPSPVGSRLAIPGSGGGGHVWGNRGNALWGPLQKSGHPGCFTSGCEVGGGQGVPCVRWWRVCEVAEVRWGGPRLFHQPDRKLEGPCVVGAIPPRQIGSLCCRGRGGGGRFFDQLQWALMMQSQMVSRSSCHL